MRKLRVRKILGVRKILLALSIGCIFVGGLIYASTGIVIDRSRFVSQQKIQQINFNAYTGESERVGLKRYSISGPLLLVGPLDYDGTISTSNGLYTFGYSIPSIIGYRNNAGIAYPNNLIVGGSGNRTMAIVTHTGLENSVIVGGEDNRVHGLHMNGANVVNGTGRNNVVLSSIDTLTAENNHIVLGLTDAEIHGNYGASFIGDRVRIYSGGSLTFGDEIELGHEPSSSLGVGAEGHFVFNGHPGHQVEYGGNGTSSSMLIGLVEHGLVIGSGKILNNTGVKLSVDGAIGLGVGKCSASYAGSVYYLTGVTTNGGNIACLCACVGSGESVDSIALSNAPYCDSVCDNPAEPVNGKGQCGSRGKESPEALYYEAGETDWRPGSEFCADGTKPAVGTISTHNRDVAVPFPGRGSHTSWVCSGLTLADDLAECHAFRKAGPAECGVNAKSYYLNDTDYVGREEIDFCSGGVYSGVDRGEIEFPGYGETVSWKCVVDGMGDDMGLEEIECSAYHKDCNRCAKNGFPYCFDIDLDENCPTDPNETPMSGSREPLQYYHIDFACSPYENEPRAESYPVGETGYLPLGDRFCPYSYNPGYVGQLNTYQGGKKFKGWAVVSGSSVYGPELGIEYPKGAAVYNLGDVGETVYLRGIWEDSPTYTVKYDCNGGSYEEDSSPATVFGYPFTIGQAERLHPRNACKKDGYYFVGWSTSPTSTVPMYGPAEYVKDLGAAGSTVTLYAVYDHTGIYGVIYNCNGHDKKMGGLNMRVSYFPVGGGGYLSLNSCWEPRSTFAGWKTSSSDVVYPDGSYFSDPSKHDGGYTSVKAVWNDL